MDTIDIQQVITGLPVGWFTHLPRLGSTNDLATHWAMDGAPDFSLVFADEQTAGRGRAQRHWFTPPGSALAFSVLLRAEAAEIAHSIGFFSGLGALAVAIALENLYELQPEIKWPNDVLLRGKKTAGILVETSWLGHEIQAIILGIGVNVFPGAVPPADKVLFPATCIAAETSLPVRRTSLLREILQAILLWRPRIAEPAFLLEWEKRLAFRNQPVYLDLGNGNKIIGKIAGLSPEGMLRLRAEDDSLHTYPIGEISLRPSSPL